MGDMFLEQQFPAFQIHYPQARLPRRKGVIDDGQPAADSPNPVLLGAFHRGNGFRNHNRV